jgi:hypothetical protein
MGKNKNCFFSEDTAKSNPSNPVRFGFKSKYGSCELVNLLLLRSNKLFAVFFIREGIQHITVSTYKTNLYDFVIKTFPFKIVTRKSKYGTCELVNSLLLLRRYFGSIELNLFVLFSSMPLPDSLELD